MDENPTRQAILALLQERELYAGEIAERLGIRRPTLSHHLGVLLDQRLVRVRAQGPFRFYSLVPPVAPVKPVTKNPKIETETPFTAAFKRIARERGYDPTKPRKDE
jgi:DNA-binding transcriptional ArsR family regulator